MSYLDQSANSKRILALGIVGLLHVALGYAFVTGLALRVAKQVFTPIETVNIEEEEPPPEEPPPPPEQLEEIPVVTPPPLVTVETPPPPQPITTETTVVRPIIQAPAPVRPAPPAPPVVAPPAPPPPAPSQAAPGRLLTNVERINLDEYYPAAALRREEQGTTGMAFTVAPNGRIAECTVTSSSGSSTLDEAACRLARRELRYEAARNAAGERIESKTTFRFRWVLPER